MFASAIHLALEVVVELPDGIHNPEEELSAHPITAPKCFVAVKWSIGKVVGVEHEVAFETMLILCFHPPRRRATSPRLFIAREQLGEGGMRCSSSWTSAVASSSSSAASASSSSESIVEAGKFPNTLRPVGAYPPLNCPSAAGNGGKNAQLLVEGLPWENLGSFSGGDWLSSGEGRWAAPGYSWWRLSAPGVGGESGKKNLTFLLTVWASHAFPLRRSPRAPPKCAGFCLRSPCQKTGRTGGFRRPGARLGFFRRQRRKSGLEGLLRRGWRCSHTRMRVAPLDLGIARTALSERA